MFETSGQIKPFLQSNVQWGCAFQCNLDGDWCDGYHTNTDTDPHKCHLISVNELFDSGASNMSGPFLNEVYERIDENSKSCH